MKIQKHTRQVLEKSTPKWLKRLCQVNFHGEDLEELDRMKLKDQYHSCMIGELHDFTSHYYTIESGACMDCLAFCHEIPQVMGVRHNDVSENYSPIRINGVLDRLAKHIEKTHPDLMNKDSIPNECKT